MGQAEGIKVCCGAIEGEMDFAGDFIVPLCIFICLCVCVCGCVYVPTHPFLMSAPLCVPPFWWPVESYFSIFES